jgi:hypothetical protein
MMYMRSLPVTVLLYAIAAIILCSAGCVQAPGTTAGNSGAAGVAVVTPAPGGTSYVLVETLTPAPTVVTAAPAYRPLVVPQEAGDTVQENAFSFQYRDVPYSVMIPVNASLYQAARDSPNKQLNLSGMNDTAALYRNMMNDPAMNPFFDGLVREISRDRYKGGDNMTDDEYLEMVTSFVQQIPVDNRTSGNPRYPVEVIADGRGTSDEKAMLLTGILSREGYDTAFLYFPGMHRGASGIGIRLASNHPSFRIFSDGMRDYVYIEPSTTRLIGIYDNDIDTAPDPVVIPLGNGTAGYTHINFVMGIFTDVRTMEDQLKTYDEESGTSRQLSPDDYQAAVSYVNTYDFVMSTNDPDAAYTSIRASELRHHSVCVTCG